MGIPITPLPFPAKNFLEVWSKIEGEQKAIKMLEDLKNCGIEMENER